MYQIRDLTPNTLYYVRVTAVNSVGPGRAVVTKPLAHRPVVMTP